MSHRRQLPRAILLGLALSVAAWADSLGKADAGSPSPRAVKTVSRFHQLLDEPSGAVVQLHLAPAAVTLYPEKWSGEIYPEPCDPKDPANTQSTKKPTMGLVIQRVPFEIADRLNTQVNAETDQGQTWTCFDVMVKVASVKKLKRGGGTVEATYLSSEPRGSRKVNPAVFSGD